MVDRIWLGNLDIFNRWVLEEEKDKKQRISNRILTGSKSTKTETDRNIFDVFLLDWEGKNKRKWQKLGLGADESSQHHSADEFFLVSQNWLKEECRAEQAGEHQNKGCRVLHGGGGGAECRVNTIDKQIDDMKRHVRMKL